MRSLLWLLNKYNNILVFIILEIIAIILLSNHNAYQHSVLVNANREISGSIFEKVSGIRQYLYLKQNNEILITENTRLKNKIEQLTWSTGITDSTLTEFATDSLLLRDTTYLYTYAKIVHGTHYKQFNYFTIDKGRKDGIKANMGVTGAEGIVGIVLESSANYSTVIPIINRDSRLSVKVKKNNFSGILQWEGVNHRQASLNEIPFHAEIAIGDTIVTSGFSAIFPEGLFVGTISDFSLQQGNFYQITIDLGVDYQRIFHVNVINNYRQDEQLKLESKLN